MTLRTAKLHGYVFPLTADLPVTVEVLFNNNIVYAGPAINDGTVTDYGASTVASWQFDSNISGVVPVSIHVTNGDLKFVDILMNYCDAIYKESISDSAVWANYTPVSAEEVVNDLSLTDAEILEKYGLTRDQVRENLIEQTVLSFEDNFQSPNDNSVETDGKNNVRINNILQSRVVLSEEFLGDWHYLVRNGERLDCDFTIQPPVFE